MDFGFTKDYFLHLNVLNNKNSWVFTIVFFTMMFITGGAFMYLISASLALLLAMFTQHFIINRRIDLPSDGLVIVTGTSTGLGRAAVMKMITNNIHIIATVRKQADKDSLLTEYNTLKQAKKAVGVLDVALMDLSNDADIDTFVVYVEKYLEENKLKFLALFNNAAVMVTSVVEKIDRETYERQFNTNVFGTMHLTNGLLPAMRKYRHSTIYPKIVGISSSVAKITSIDYGIYSASKKALEGVYDALRQEVARQKIQVVLIEPGMFATALLANTVKMSEVKAEALKKDNDGTARLEDDVEAYYTDLKESFDAKVVKASAGHPSPISVGAETYEFILKSSSPLHRYCLGRDSQMMVTMVNWFGENLVDISVPWIATPLEKFQKKKD